MVGSCEQPTTIGLEREAMASKGEGHAIGGVLLETEDEVGVDEQALVSGMPMPASNAVESQW